MAEDPHRSDDKADGDQAGEDDDQLGHKELAVEEIVGCGEECAGLKDAAVLSTLRDRRKRKWLTRVDRRDVVEDSEVEEETADKCERCDFEPDVGRGDLGFEEESESGESDEPKQYRDAVLSYQSGEEEGQDVVQSSASRHHRKKQQRTEQQNSADMTDAEVDRDSARRFCG